jgi:4'-phosphopantetheinyl transferase
MSHPAPVDVWLIALDAAADWLPPMPSEAERAARFVSPSGGQRYLRSHAALRAILQGYTAAPLEFAAAEHGKPYLAAVPGLRFNLSHSYEMALVAVAWDVEVGVDVEYFRPMPECTKIAERFFPPVDAAALEDVPADAREREFFHRWTHIEALLKARGIGLYGAGTEPEGEWIVEPVAVGAEYAGAVAAMCPAITVAVRVWQPNRI